MKAGVADLEIRLAAAKQFRHDEMQLQVWRHLQHALQHALQHTMQHTLQHTAVCIATI